MTIHYAYRVFLENLQRLALQSVLIALLDFFHLEEMNVEFVKMEHILIQENLIVFRVILEKVLSLETRAETVQQGRILLKD